MHLYLYWAMSRNIIILLLCCALILKTFLSSMFYIGHRSSLKARLTELTQSDPRLAGRAALSLQRLMPLQKAKYFVPIHPSYFQVTVDNFNTCWTWFLTEYVYVLYLPLDVKHKKSNNLCFEMLFECWFCQLVFGF